VRYYPPQMPCRYLLVALLAAFLAACGEPSDAPPRSTGETLIVTNTVDIDAVNNLISEGATIARDVERLMFLQLVRERPASDAGPATFEPQLAESWEFSEDRLTLTFKLREAVWTDGTPITAENVRWTWTAQIDPAVAWRWAGEKKAVQDVEVVDARTVRFHFSEAYPEQLDDANDGAILPSHVWSELPFSEWRSNGRWFVDHMVSSGPFVLVRSESGQEVVLRRNESYYKEGLPKLERLAVRVVPDKGNQVSQLLGGTVGYLQGLPPAQIERVEANPAAEIDAFWGRALDYVCWNTRLPPFDDPRVRRALTRAIDRQTIIDSVFRGYARRAVSLILSTTWAFNDALEPWPYDPQRAREELEAAGFTDADGDGMLEWQGEPFEPELLVQAANQVHSDVATLIEVQLERVGIDLKVRPTEFQIWLGQLRDNDFEAAVGQWNTPTSLDPSFAFHTREAGHYNFGHFSNLELDALLDRLKEDVDVEERKRILYEIQEVLHQQQPYTFLWEPQRLNARTGRLRDSRPNELSSFYNIDEWWLDPER
jgi:peptide/nickel transport system substrate-binding protein